MMEIRDTKIKTYHKINRYRCNSGKEFGGDIAIMIPDKQGEWIKFKEIEELIKNVHNKNKK